MATEQSQKLITITPKAAEKIKEFMAEETEKPQYLRYMFRVVDVLVFLMVWVLKKRPKKTI